MVRVFGSRLNDSIRGGDLDLLVESEDLSVGLEHGCTWVTRDTDFEAFRSVGLRLEILQTE